MAKACGVSQPTVWGWLHQKGMLPAKHVLTVSKRTSIPPWELRPDIYPPEIFDGQKAS